MTSCNSIFGLTLTSLLALAAFPANAADMYSGYKDGAYGTAFSWTGFYAGINGGYAWDAFARRNGQEDDGGFGGGQIGYNWQGALGVRPLVLGAEADFEGVGIDHSKATTITWDSGGTDSALHTREIDFIGTVRGRIGYAAGLALIYFTGGFAYGDKNNEFDDTGINHPGIYRDDGMKAGYVLGGGLEYKLTPAWSVKAEYQYIDLAHDNATGNNGHYVGTMDTELDTFRGGINYQFNSPYAPLK
jgi:outer membrane immunogenic protein